MADKFEAGQRIEWSRASAPVTVISGPHETYGADRWLVRKADGKVTLVREGELSAIRDRRTLVAEALYESLAFLARKGAFPSLDRAAQAQYFRAADKVLAALDAEAPESKPRIRILHDRLGGANVKRGQILTVKQFNAGLSGTLLHAETKEMSRGYWSFSMSSEGTGWERV